MLSKFVVLEIDDRKVVNLFEEIAVKYHLEIKKPHLTLRGPYTDNIPAAVAERVWKVVDDIDQISIDGVGVFDSKGISVLYLKVVGDGLREVWWKPSFPIGLFGYHPHITIADGDPEIIHRAFEELTSRSIQFSFSGFHVAERVSKQKSLFDL